MPVQLRKWLRLDDLKSQEKYSRQTILTEIGVAGQKDLSNAKVAIIGVGALGTNSAELLTRAGIGNLLLIDPDIIEESNLQRQTLFNEDDVGKSKTITAKEKLEKINSLIKIKTENITLNKNNISILKEFDLILDCTDNLPTRFVINKFCKENKLPWIYAACVKTHGYVMPIMPKQACLNCFLQEVDLDSSCTLGILNTVPSSIAALQSTLAIKIILNQNIESILYYQNLWTQNFKKIKVKINKNCELCT